MSYFAAALARTADGWAGRELDLNDVDNIDGVADMLRDMLRADDEGPAVLLLEENDEYVGIVRVDPDADEARSFISDVRAVETSEHAALFYDDTSAEPVPDDDAAGEEEEGTQRPQGEPGGDDSIVADLGTRPAQLRELCAEEGLLPADVISAVCERAGCADVLEELRGG